MNNPIELYVWHKYPIQKPSADGWYIVAFDEFAFPKVGYIFYDCAHDHWDTRLDIYAWGYNPKPPKFEQ